MYVCEGGASNNGTSCVLYHLHLNFVPHTGWQFFLITVADDMVGKSTKGK